MRNEIKLLESFINPKDCKMTEWRECRIGDIAEILNQKRRPLNSREREIRKGIYPYYGASGIFDYIDDFLFDGEHVLISEDGENLRTRNTSIAFKVKDKFWVNNHAHIVKGHHPFLNDWIVYYFQILDINPYITGAVQPKLNKENLLSIPIYLPDYKTAESITEILRSLDDKIELNNKINQNLETLAQTLFKQWFIDFDFPDENRQPYKSSGGFMVESELGNIPKGWIIEKLGNLVNTTSGGTPSRSKPDYYENGNILWVKSKELNNSMFFDTEEKINKIGLKNSSAKIVPPYSILIAMYGATVGQFGLITEEATCNQAICAVIPNEELPYSFIYLFIQNYRKEFSNLAVGSAQQNISQDLIKNTKLIKPPHEMLKEFHKIIDASLKTIENNCRENNELKNLRDSLLPKLISGELKISEVQNLEPV